MAAPRDEGANSSADAFFARCGLPASARARCWGFAKEKHPDAAVCESPSQGYCSFTFCVGQDTILQFRPPTHQLDVNLAERVTEVYGDLAPTTTFVGTLDCSEESQGGVVDSLLVYSMTRIPGISLAAYREASDSRQCRKEQHAAQRTALIRAFARLLARSWYSQRHPADPSLLSLRGKVGGSLRWRLERMQRDLPSRFQPYVARTLEQLPRIEALPWVLTHGDVVPSNIMVEVSPGDGSGPRLTGLLDWAEAEFLPFGVGLYGAEELLGETAVPWDGEGPYPPRGSRFMYFDDAPGLRTAFWSELEVAIPTLRTDEQLTATVRAARDLGLLLWHGIAFDDGRLDRVVQEGRDDEEVQRLDLFLRGEEYVPQSAMAEEGGESDAAPPSGRAWQRARRLSLSDLAKRTWTYLRHFRFPEQMLGKL